MVRIINYSITTGLLYLFWHLCCVSLGLLNSEVFFGQYKCWGPGANTTQRVPWAFDLTPVQAKPFLSVNFINGKSWLKSYIKTPKYTWHCGERPQVLETLLKMTSDLVLLQKRWMASHELPMACIHGLYNEVESGHGVKVKACFLQQTVDERKDIH